MRKDQTLDLFAIKYCLPSAQVFYEDRIFTASIY
jgi:hypothetical protein